MKYKSSLVLMELLVMAAVFSLAAALCLTAFFRADRISREQEQKDRAVLFCQNTAEIVKNSGSLEAAAEILSARQQGDCWVVPSDDGSILLKLQETEAPVPGMGQAELTAVASETGKTLFTLTVGWQEVAP